MHAAQLAHNAHQLHEMDRLRQKLDQERKTAAAEKGEWVTKLTSLHQNNNQLREESQWFESELSRKTAHAETLASECDKLRTKAEEHEEKNNILKRDLEDAKGSADELEQKLEDERKNAANNAATLQAQFVRKSDELTAMTVALNDATQAKEQAEAEMNEKHRAALRLEKELVEAHADNTTLKQECDRADRRCASLER
jgi:chromosome segregation ATPase